MLELALLVFIVAVVCWLLASYVLTPVLVRPVCGIITGFLVLYLLVCLFNGHLWTPAWWHR